MKNIMKKDVVVGYEKCLMCGAKLKEEQDIPICDNCKCVR